ncbi:MAG: succinate dehydrogenase/fumarate reductase iron-sulfur subunit, partial [Burkholderiales bacterium]|nr:succinate dehydrogenase/fumarate reductase iron-sulfur subunit [Burkholderiales bacterium]
MSTQSMSFNLRVWRQDGPQAPGRLVDYKVVDISP